jgi:hypothetical protein
MTQDLVQVPARFGDHDRDGLYKEDSDSDST